MILKITAETNFTGISLTIPPNASVKGCTKAQDACFSTIGLWSQRELISVILMRAFILNRGLVRDLGFPSSRSLRRDMISKGVRTRQQRKERLLYYKIRPKQWVSYEGQKVRSVLGVRTVQNHSPKIHGSNYKSHEDSPEDRCQCGWFVIPKPIADQYRNDYRKCSGGIRE